MDGLHPAVRSVSFGDLTGLEHLIAQRPRIHRVRQIAPVTFVAFHARTHMEDNEMTQRNLAQLAKTQRF